MEVERFINGRPVTAVPQMEVVNEGVLRIIREVRGRPVRSRSGARGERPPRGRDREPAPAAGDRKRLP